MSQIDNEQIEIIDESFTNLKECIDYYTDILACLRDGLEQGLYTKREYKKKKKFVMTQYEANLRVIKKVDKCSRESKTSRLKHIKNLNSTSFIEKNNNQIENSLNTYQIEDIKETFYEKDKEQ